MADVVGLCSLFQFVGGNVIPYAVILEVSVVEPDFGVILSSQYLFAAYIRMVGNQRSTHTPIQTQTSTRSHRNRLRRTKAFVSVICTVA